MRVLLSLLVTWSTLGSTQGCDYLVVFKTKLTAAEEMLANCDDCKGDEKLREIAVEAIETANEFERKLMKIENMFSEETEYESGCVSAMESGSGLMLTYTPTDSNINTLDIKLKQPATALHINPDTGSAEAWVPHSLVDAYIKNSRLLISLTSSSGKTLTGLLLYRNGGGGGGGGDKVRETVPEIKTKTTTKKTESESSKPTKPTLTKNEIKKQRLQSAETHILWSQIISSVVLVASVFSSKRPFDSPTKILNCLTVVVTIDTVLMSLFKTSFMHGIPRAAAAIILCICGWFINKSGQFTPAYMSVLAGFLMWQGNPRY